MPVPRTNNLIRGANAFKIGMTKSEIRSVYGEPDAVRTVVAHEWGGDREEWSYSGKTPLSVSAGYLGSDTYLYFDGNILTNISDRPIGKAEEVIEEEK
ncbi:MAG: hypothetical protein PHW14_00755 [Candidatus Omnitrophica bacterium]|nr:hypothetical protein [Candidatus Omnitrophota bacterium]